MNGVTVARKIAQLLAARENCITSNNTEWVERHTETIKTIVSNALPSGSGWDSGTAIDLDASTPDHLILFGSYHHMNDGGYYDGWTDHTIHVKASLAFGFTIKITGRNRNDIKDYLSELFHDTLGQTVEPVTT